MSVNDMLERLESKLNNIDPVLNPVKHDDEDLSMQGRQLDFGLQQQEDEQKRKEMEKARQQKELESQQRKIDFHQREEQDFKEYWDLKEDLFNAADAQFVCKQVAGQINMNFSNLYNEQGAEQKERQIARQKAEQETDNLTPDERKRRQNAAFLLTNPFFEKMTPIEKDHEKWLHDNRTLYHPVIYSALEKVLFFLRYCPNPIARQLRTKRLVHHPRYRPPFMAYVSLMVQVDSTIMGNSVIYQNNDTKKMLNGQITRVQEWFLNLKEL
jgi:hypothetical protein